MSDGSALEKPKPAAEAEAGARPAPVLESPPPAGYAGRPRDAELEYKAILANASIGIAFTRDRRFTLCNPKFAEMFGWEAGELIGQSGEIVYPSRESYEALGAIAVPLLGAGKQLDVEWEVRRRDGSTFLCRMIAKAVSAAEPRKGTVWIVEDVTSRKRHADEVARLLREQEAILDTATIGICFVRERRIVRCNRRMERMYGYGAGELNGKPTSVTYASAADYAKADEGYAEMARGQTHTHVMQARRRDGTLFWERSSGHAVDPGEPSRGSVWLLEDISEQRRAEEELQRVLAEQKALSDNVVVGIAFIRERAIQRCNRCFEQMFGYDAGELAGASARQLYFTDEDFEQRRATYGELDAGRTHAREQWMRRKDGSGFWCRLSARAVEPGNPAKGYVWLFDDATEQHAAEERVRKALAEQKLILDNATVGILFVRDRVIQRCNRFLEEMFGYGAGELAGKSSAALFDSDEDWKRAGELSRATALGETHDAEWRFRRKDGTTFVCRNRGRRIDSGDAEQEWIWSLEDVTLEREAEARVQQALREQELILANATVGIAFSRRRVFQRCNPRLEEMFGYGAGELAGRSSAELFVSQDEYDSSGAAMFPQLAGGAAWVDERQLKRKDDTRFWCKVVVKAIDPLQAEEGTIAIFEDMSAERAARDALERAVAERTAELQAANRRLQAEISERKQAETRAQHLADHDPLTALPNRRLLEDRLTQALAASQRNRRQTAVMFVDLDRFKAINDSVGHAAGDILLKEVADRLVKQLRVVDTTCRIGGDEFVVVLPEIRRSSDAANVAQKIIETVSQPVAAEGHQLQITPSIGISVFPDDGRDAETLIRNADAAMYHAKETGRANYQFFTAQMNQTASRRLALENDLRQAVLRGEMRVWYQPVVDAKTGARVLHEALLRWQHPTRGLIEAHDFIHLADDTGLILRLGEWALGEACRWGCFIGAERGLPVSVNLSPRQFADPRLADAVARALKESGLPPALLQLEVAESAAMQHADVALATLRKLKELGVWLALDDFGVGLSGVAHLRRFPLDTLKIDCSLVAEAHRDADHSAVVAAIVALGHALGLKVTGKGVETEQQRALLLACGCDRLQGTLVGPPADADAASKDYV